MPVSRTSMLAKLSDAYSVYFDEEPVDSGTPPLAACYAFHSTDECFVLSRKVRLWRAEINEFVYVFSVPELSAELYESCRGKALELGMAKIRPHIEHRSSFITALFICDSITEQAAKAVRGTITRTFCSPCTAGWIFAPPRWIFPRATSPSTGPDGNLSSSYTEIWESANSIEEDLN